MNFTSEQLELIGGLKSKGYRVFVADTIPSRFYGFFTDSTGSRVVSFFTDYGWFNLSGNYVTDNPRQCGQGWQIGNYLSVDNILSNADKYFSETAPTWAVGLNKWRYKTLAEHLNQYGKSSNYTEM